MDAVSLETSPVHLAKYVSIIRSMKNVLTFCAQPLLRQLSSEHYVNSFHQPRSLD